MNKTTYLIVFLLFFGTTSSVVFAQAPATITFDDQGFAGCDELNDAQVFSAIGKTFNIYAANFDGTPSENGSLWYESASGGCWHPYATVMGDGGYITAGYSSNSAYQWYDPKALAIKTIDGSDFKFISFKSHDAGWDKWGNYLKITGYKDGVSLGSESVVIVSDVEPYYSTVTLTNPVFNSVDEVRITMDKDNNPQFNDPGIVHSDADGLFQSFDTFVIDNAVSSASAPTISTAIASAITDAGATLNGNVTSDGGATVSANGFVYSSTDTSPTIGEGGVTNVPNSNVGTGAFSEAISGLSASTTYYYQAYATNSAGTAYGGVESFTTLATLGLQEDLLKQAISLYPNPVNDVLYIKTNDLKVTNVVLFDVLGKRITNIKIKNDAINLSNLKMGIYILKVETAPGNVVKRIIKK